MSSGDTWTLQLTAEDLALVRWGLVQAQDLITPSWWRLAAEVEYEVGRGQLDPQRVFRALWPVCAAHLAERDGLNRPKRIRLRALALRIKDAVEIITALEEAHG